MCLHGINRQTPTILPKNLINVFNGLATLRMQHCREETDKLSAEALKLVCTISTQSAIRALQTLVDDIIFIVELCKELGRSIQLPRAL